MKEILWVKPMQSFKKEFSFAQTAEEGAQTSIYLAVSKEVDNISGEFFSDCKQASTFARAKSPSLCKDVWDKSEELVKLKPEERQY